jgi:HEAT repeat protein
VNRLCCVPLVVLALLAVSCGGEVAPTAPTKPSTPPPPSQEDKLRLWREDMRGAPEHQFRAVRAIGPEDGPPAGEAVPALLDVLRRNPLRAPDDNPPPERREALAAVKRLGGRAVAPLRKALRDPATRDVACDALVELGPEAREAAPDIIDTFAKDEQRYPDDRRDDRALRAIGRDAVPALVAATQEKDARRRGRAFYVLYGLGAEAEAALPALTDEIRRGEPDGYTYAGDALIRIGAPAIPALVGQMVDPQPLGQYRAEFLRRSAMVLLARMGAPAVPALREALGHPNASVRACAAEALGRFTPPATAAGAVPELGRALRDGDATVRQRAAAALGNIGPEARAAAPLLREALGDPAADVRLSAAYALCGRAADERGRAEPVLVALYRDAHAARPLPWTAGLVLDGPLRVALRWSVLELRGGEGDALRRRAYLAGLLLTEPGGRAAPLLPMLIEKLEAPDRTGRADDVRSDAALFLSRLGPDAAGSGPKLVPLLRRPQAREAACAALVSLGPEAGDGTVAALRAILDEGEPEARWLAFLALASVDPDAARARVPSLGKVVEALSGPTARGFWEDRRKAHRVVALAGDGYNTVGWQDQSSGARGLLGGALKDVKPTSKEEGILLVGAWRLRKPYGDDYYVFDALGRSRGAAAAEAAPTLVTAVVRSELDHPHWGEAAADALPGMGAPAVPALRAALTSPRPRPIAQIIGLIGPDARDAVPDLVKALQGNSRGLRLEAAEALGRIGPDAREALPALLASFKDKELCPAAVRAVGRLGKEAVPPLMEGLKGADAATRAGSAEALGRLGPEAKPAVPKLLALRDNPREDSSVRAAAAQALMVLDPE